MAGKLYTWVCLVQGYQLSYIANFELQDTRGNRQSRVLAAQCLKEPIVDPGHFEDKSFYLLQLTNLSLGHSLKHSVQKTCSLHASTFENSVM